MRWWRGRMIDWKCDADTARVQSGVPRLGPVANGKVTIDSWRDSWILVKLTLCGFCAIQRGRYNIGENHVA